MIKWLRCWYWAWSMKRKIDRAAKRNPKFWNHKVEWKNYTGSYKPKEKP